MTKDFLISLEQYINNGGILSGSSFAPVHIRQHKMIDRTMASEYLEQNRELFFVEQLLALIDKSGKKDSDIYKAARIDRRLFSKIRSNKAYTPSKKTVVSLCLALKLPRNEFDLLLSSAGYSLSRADNFDLIIAFCIEQNVYDIFEINEALNHFGLDVLD